MDLGAPIEEARTFRTQTYLAKVGREVALR